MNILLIYKKYQNIQIFINQNFCIQKESKKNVLFYSGILNIWSVTNVEIPTRL